MENRRFDELLIEAVDEALSSLGESVKQAIYFHLQNQFHLSKDEIPRRIRDFANGIEAMFGPGARFIEILIMKKLYNKVGGFIEWDEHKEFTFAEYVEAARRSFQSRRCNVLM
ncbi:MAG: hypothetical protein N3F10_06700 [Candidatus Bathyarchaeota archaeon]|nr:hypothetical protein [Candidatus Bathyarchaeota archaeon]